MASPCYSFALILIGRVAAVRETIGQIASLTDAAHRYCPDRLPNVVDERLLPPSPPLLLVSGVHRRDRLEQLQSHFRRHGLPFATAWAGPLRARQRRTQLTLSTDDATFVAQRGPDSRVAPRMHTLAIGPLLDAAAHTPLPHQITARLHLGALTLVRSASRPASAEGLADLDRLFTAANAAARDFCERYNAHLPKECPNCGTCIVPGLRCATCDHLVPLAWQIFRGDEYGTSIAAITDQRRPTAQFHLAI